MLTVQNKQKTSIGSACIYELCKSVYLKFSFYSVQRAREMDQFLFDTPTYKCVAKTTPTYFKFGINQCIANANVSKIYGQTVLMSDGVSMLKENYCGEEFRELNWE